MTQSSSTATARTAAPAGRADEKRTARSPVPSTTTSPAPRVLHAPSTPGTPARSLSIVEGGIPTDVRLRTQWEGYLQKRSDWLKHWETYYFVLRGRSLYCYLSEEDARRQPEKSKIKKGKFGFADRVTLTRVWDVDEAAALAAAGSSTLATPPPTPTGSQADATAVGAQAADALAPPAAPPPLVLVPVFRFTLETDKGHQLHFRTNSAASKHVWLQFAATAVADFDAALPAGLPSAVPRATVADFYRSFEYLYAALSVHVSAEMAAAMEAVAFYPATEQGSDSASIGTASTTGAAGTASGKKVQTTFRAVAPNESLERSAVRPPLDHALARFFSMLSPDVTLRSNYLPMVPFEGTYRGYSGVLEFLTRLSQSVCFEQFVVERIEVEDEDGERVPFPDGLESISQSTGSRVLIISGREMMQVRFNQTTFAQQWTHKLHFKPTGGGAASRWEIFGDVVASSVVFKSPGYSTNLVLPSLAERIRESFVGGYIVSIQLHEVADVRSVDVQQDTFFVRCSLDTNEFEGVWHTEAQSRAAPPVHTVDDKAKTPGATSAYIYHQELHLQFDRLSRDDNTILLVEFCRASNREVVARTHVNLANFLNPRPDSSSSSSRWRSSRRRKSAASPRGPNVHSYVLANDRQNFLGKLRLGVSIAPLSAAGRASRSSMLRASASSDYDLDSPSGSVDGGTTPRNSNSSSLRALATSAARLASLSASEQPQDELMHQFVINGVRYQLAEKYRMVKIVGKGTYGEVIAASDFVNGGTFAIKKLANFARHPKVALLALREIRLLRALGAHPCLMAVHELQKPLDYAHFEDLYLIQPLMETDLCRVIHSKERISDEQMQYFIYQLLCGLHYLHSADVLHRDLKPSNVLVNSDCRVRIADFGLARHAGASDVAEGLSEYVVTRWYRAPELLLANAYSTAIDLWAVGCILAELLGRRVLFPGSSYVDQLKLIVDIVGTPTTFSFCDNPAARRFAGRQFLLQSAHVPKVDWSAIFPEANPDALDLLDKLLQFDPARRISAKDALEHPYVSQWRDPRLEAPCAPDVAKRLVQSDLTLPPDADPETLKRLLFDEVLAAQQPRPEPAAA